MGTTPSWRKNAFCRFATQWRISILLVEGQRSLSVLDWISMMNSARYAGFKVRLKDSSKDRLMSLPVVNSFNEWDPLEEVIVGVLDGGSELPWDITLKAVMPKENVEEV